MERLLYALRNVNFSFVSTLVSVKPVGHKFLSLWPLPQWWLYLSCDSTSGDYSRLPCKRSEGNIFTPCRWDGLFVRCFLSYLCRPDNLKLISELGFRLKLFKEQFVCLLFSGCSFITLVENIPLIIRITSAKISANFIQFLLLGSAASEFFWKLCF